MSSVSTTNQRYYVGPRSQRGAIGIWGSLTLLLAVLFMALAVDAGRLWMQQRKLQSIVDIAAMEAARNMGCNIDAGDVADAAQAAAVRNGYTGQLTQDPNVVELGSITTVSGVRQFIPGTPQEAVHVYATQSVPASLVVGGLFGNQVVLHAEAVAAADPPLVAFTAGSYLLSVDDESASLMNALLGNLLGSTLNINVLSYQGLASANLSLANLLRVQGQALTVNELLNTEMALDELVDLVVAGVADAGTATTLAAGALQQLSAGTNGTAIRLADILAVTAPNEDAAAAVDLNAFSLITAGAMLANKQHAVTLPLAVNAPPIASIDAQITIVEAPQLAVGPSDGNSCTVARTAQLQVNATASLAGTLNLDLNLVVAQGSAELASFNDNGNESHVVIAASPGVASLTGTASIVLNPPLLPAVTVPVAISLPIASATAQNLDFFVDHPVQDNLPQMQSVSSPLGDSLQNALQLQNVLDIPVLGAVLEPLLTPIVNTLLSPLLGEIGRVLLDPLLEMLGIRLGGMDVTLHDIQLRQARPLII